MTSALADVEEKVEKALQEGEEILREVQTFGWEDDRPDRILVGSQLVDLDDLMYRTEESRRVPVTFVSRCSKWYTTCLALLETNMANRRSELPPLMKFLYEHEYITEGEQQALARDVRQIQHLVGSIPAYLESRLYDLELGLAQGFTRDLLLEAETLLKTRHIRAAGAIAGVLLERHLKKLCNRNQPPIRFSPRTTTISALNDLLWKAGVYDQKIWRSVQWMGDVRNVCDHANAAEPERKDVQKLIREVSDFVSFFVV